LIDILAADIHGFGSRVAGMITGITNPFHTN
jgi:hypothetical protein